MKKVFIFLCSLFIFQSEIFAQSATCPALITNNYTVTCSTPCVKIGVGATINLNGTETYSVTSIPYSPYSYTAGTDATYGGGAGLLTTYDDEWGDAVGIGFGFCFFGNTYTQVVPGSNGNITFTAANANTYDPWPQTGPLPASASGGSAAAIDNCVMFPSNDLYAVSAGGGTGTFRWAQYGTAPCRVWVYSNNNVSLFDPTDCPGMSSTEQVAIYESSNIIEVYIANRVSCSAWNSGWATDAICNTTGSAWTAAPGENCTTFGATNEAWRYTPAGAAAGWNYTWYDSTMTTVIGTGDSITVCPTVLGNTKYYVQATSIACSGVTLLDSVIVTQTSLGTAGGATIYSVTTTNPTVCGDNDGTITLVGGITPYVPDTVNYDLNGVPQPPIYTTAGADSIIVLTGLIAGNYTNIEIFNGAACPSIVSATLVNPPISASFVITQHLGCTGDTVLLSNTSTPAGFTSYWTFGDGSPMDSVDTDPTHFFIVPGTHTITLVYSTFHTCYDTVSQTISFDHILSPGFYATPDSVCLGSAINFVNTTVSNANATYSWSFGDGNSDTVTSPTYMYTAGNVYYVTLTATDTAHCQASVTETVDVVSISLAPVQSSLTLCNPQDSVLLTVAPTTAGGVPNINYVWNPTNGLGEPASNQTHFYDTSAPNVFNYTITSGITLPSGAVCSSSTNINVTSYNLNAYFISNYDTVCSGITPFQFTNGTEYFLAPNYTWTFNDGNSSNATSPSHMYNVAGIYDVLLTATDANNCSSTYSVTVNVMSVKTRSYTHDTSVCLVNPMLLNATVDVQPSLFSNLVTYQWLNIFPGTGYVLGTPNDSTTTFFGASGSPYIQYQFIFTTGYFILNSNSPCFSTDVENIYVYPPDTLRNVTANVTIQYGNSVQLNADSAYYFWWTPDNGTLNNPNINNPIATPTDSITTYTVYGLTQYGCLDSAKVTITVVPDVPSYIPSAFSPNGDGLNDQFKVGNIGFTKLVEMRIFNRWGDQVFETNNPELGWDGTWKGVPQDIGTYFYEVILSNPDGTQQTYKGDLTLVR